MSFRIHFQDLRSSEAIREECQRLSNDLRESFPEASKFEVRLSINGELHETHVHVTGKDLAVASSAADRELRDSVTEAFQRVQKQLRKRHDKQIFTRRRGAARDSWT